MDHYKATMPGRSCTLPSVTGHSHGTRHDVFGKSGAGMAIHNYGGMLIHSSTVIADWSFNSHYNCRVKTAGDGMCALGIVDDKLARCSRLKLRVDLPEAVNSEVQNGHALLQAKILAGSGSQTVA